MDPNKKNMKLKEKYIRLKPANRLYELQVPIIGITGGISSGKSTVSNIIKELGHPVLNADSLVKDIYAQFETIDYVQGLSPRSIDNNHINFKILREEFYTNKDLKQKIEAWIYSRLKSAFLRRFSEYKAPKFLIYEVPLLFERGLQEHFDLNVLVYSGQSHQIERVTKRDDVEVSLAQKIIDSQMSTEDKLKLADFVIRNESTLDNLKEEVQSFLFHYFE